MINDIPDKADKIKCISQHFWQAFYDVWLFLISNNVPLKESSVTKHVQMKYFSKKDFYETMIFWAF